ncbi:MAG TPA: formyltransferase family protein [Ktedonobacterales bacterium]|nr:formyltransferase family protein [Ktedonobacterales bacterium]
MSHPDDTRRSAHVTPVRVVFFGMTGQFSQLVLDELMRAGIVVAAVVLPGLRKRGGQPPLLLRQPSLPRGVALPMFARAAPRTILDVAAEREIPAFEFGGGELPEALTALSFDAVAVACFSRKLPRSLLRLPRLGCLNVHPSLLPRHRGPDPLFWVFHDGDEASGVTVHLMDEGFDSGPIVLSESLPLTDDTTEATLEHACAMRGGVLLAEALTALNAGAIQPQEQDASQSTYQSWPTEDDYAITPAWSARRAFRFLVGVGDRGEPTRFMAGDATFMLRAALGYDADATLGAPWQLDGNLLAAQCTPGVLRCQIAE